MSSMGHDSDSTQPFIRAIAEDVYDDTPRLVFADWLEENGNADRAEFIRVQCELEPMRDRYDIERAAALHRREKELLYKYQEEWLGPGMERWHHECEDGAFAEFRRGFVDTISLPVKTFLDLGDHTRRLHPTIRRVVFFRVHGYGKELAECSTLAGLAELELAGWYSDGDAVAIASSPFVDRLQVLELWLGRRRRLKDSRLCQIMGGSQAWPNLRELTLLNPNDENQRGRKRMVTVANEAAGRKVAVYRRGWPELFPFAADYWYLFPGYLPDGRMAMAVERRQMIPPALCVVTFDKKGKQLPGALTVAAPPDLIAIPVDNWVSHKDRIAQHLLETIGLRPGFIRIQDCRFPSETKEYDVFHQPLWWCVYSMQGEEAEFGVPDRDGDGTSYWANEPRGYAGIFAQRLRDQEYVLGWDRIADKRGRVHST